jgi:hypothetical protein
VKIGIGDVVEIPCFFHSGIDGIMGSQKESFQNKLRNDFVSIVRLVFSLSFVGMARMGFTSSMQFLPLFS